MIQKRKLSEHATQAKFIDNARFLLARCGFDRRLIFAIPNGGLRNARTGAGLKKEGATAGAPDLMVAIPAGGFHGLFIEMKTTTGRLQDNQQDYLNILNNQHYRAVVCYGYDEAIKEFIKYLQSSEEYLKNTKFSENEEFIESFLRGLNR